MASEENSGGGKKGGGKAGRKPDRTLRVTWVQSAIGRDKRQGVTIRGLGLRRLHHTVEVPDTPAVRGMINKVIHLLRVEDAG